MKYLVWLAAFILAGCAAFVSVVGLGSLFAGAGTVMLVIVGGLEFAKLVGASALHRYWDKLHGLMKFYLTVGVIFLISLTSMDIYGFLSDGYQKTADKFVIESSEIGIFEDKKATFDNRKLGNTSIIDNKNKRASTLTNLRNNQEVRLDSLLAKNYITNANRVRKDIAEANKEIQKLNDDIDVLMVKNVELSDSSIVYQRKILEIKSTSEVTAELGPLKYLSEITGMPMNNVVNWLIIIIMVVFDPMAVTLLILGNKILEMEKEEVVEEKPKKVKKERKPWITIDKIKSWIPKRKPKVQEVPIVEVLEEVEVVEEPIIEEEVLDVIEVEEPIIEEEIKEEEPVAQPTKGVVAKGKIDEDDIPMLRGDDRGFSVKIPEPKVLEEEPKAEEDKKIWHKKGSWR